MKHPGALSRKDIQDLFGFTDPALASRCFRLFLRFMKKNWGYLLTNNLDWWFNLTCEDGETYIEKCKEAIRKNATEKEPTLVFPRNLNTMNATCRVGAGPVEDGENADRNDPLIQEAFYQGWKKLHGLNGRQTIYRVI